MSESSIVDFQMNFFSLKNKNAIVTGGNTGLGQAFTLALAKAGANVLAASIMPDDGRTAAMVEETTAAIHRLATEAVEMDRQLGNFRLADGYQQLSGAEVHQLRKRA